MDCAVVVTTMGGHHLARQLAALSRQTRRPAEVVLVNNGPAGVVDRVWTEWRDRLPRARLLEDSSLQRCAFARNIGAAATSAPGLLFVDDDDEVADDYVAEMSAALDESEVVGARIDLERLNGTLLRRHWGAMQNDGLMTYHDFLPWSVGGAIGVRREVFEALGGFDASLAACEDTDFSWRAQLDLGLTVSYAPSAVVSYRLRSAPREAFRQARAWSDAERLLKRRFRDRGLVKPPPGEDPPWLTRAIGLLLLARDRPGRAVAARALGRRWGGLRERLEAARRRDGR